MSTHSVWWVPFDWHWLALEEIWIPVSEQWFTKCMNEQVTRHEHLIFVLLVAVRKDVCALGGLREEAKDVVDNKQGTFCVTGTGGISFHAINGNVFALLLVSFGHDGRDSAASVGLHG